MTFLRKEVVWIVGAKGRMGQTIEAAIDKMTYTVLATDLEVDITDFQAVEGFVSQYRPSVIINCAGSRDYAAAEANPDEAYKLNALGPLNLAICSADVDAVLVHFSSDDVFASTKGAQNEFDAPEAASVFGKSKLAGERVIREINPRHVIIRSSWVYAPLQTDLIVRACEAAKAGEIFEVSSVQFASPTPAKRVAEVILTAIENGYYGTFHATAKGMASRYEFVKCALELYGLPTDKLVPTVNEADAYRIELDNMMMRLRSIEPIGTWRDELKDYVARHPMSE